MGKSGNSAKSGWDPIRILRLGEGLNPITPMARAHVESKGTKTHYAYRTPMRSVDVMAFGNRLYDGVALTFEDTSMHLSFKRRDRAAVRDWRHFQAIKNSVAGPEREAVEIFPPESNLVDAANEYHLWILPEGLGCPLGFDAGVAVAPAADQMDHAAYRRGGPPGARQRAWEPGIPTGMGRSESADGD